MPDGGGASVNRASICETWANLIMASPLNLLPSAAMKWRREMSMAVKET